MKHLFILRHGKAKTPGSCADHDRTLKRRGRDESARMGRYLADAYGEPDLCLVSSAARTVETHAIVTDAADWDVPVLVDDHLYLPTLPVLIECLGRVPTDVQRILLVGHNPGLEQLTYHLTQIDVILPTTGLAVVGLDRNDWDLMDARAELVEQTRGSDVGG